MAEIKWPEKRRLIGTKVPRLDGPDKATGRARYSQDINRPGMLHALILRSPYAHCRIKSLDLSQAQKAPGVRAIVTVGQVNYTAGRKEGKPGWEYPVSVTDVGRELFYHGDEILAIAADTEEHARDALRLVKIEYEQLPFIVKEETALQKRLGPSTVPGKDASNVLAGGSRTEGDPDGAKKAAEVLVKGTYGVPVITHCCLETHGLVAEWESPKSLTIWCTTQAVPGTAGQLQGFLAGHGITCSVRCITHHMGGGYGSKFGPDIQGQLAAVLALVAKAPVKLFLDRDEEHLAAGNRPSATATVTIGGSRNGTITVFEAASYGTPGVGRAAGVNIGILPYVYEVRNVRISTDIVRLNHGAARAMRAPAHPQNCFITECAVDDFANAAGLDPMEVRLKNLPQNDPAAVTKIPTSFPALRNTIYTDEIRIAAELSQWKKKWHPPGKGPIKGPWKHGIGMALHTWGGAGRADNDVFVTISSDGSVLVQCSTQDLGTGERTVLAIVVAEALGLDPKDLTVVIGESQIGRSTGSGGSTTAPGTAPAALVAAINARDELFRKVAPKLGLKPDDLVLEPNKITDKASGKTFTWRQFCARLGVDTVRGQGNWIPGLSNLGVGGVQVAEVWVDTETGVVRLDKIVAVQDCGMVINKLACESQVAGGVIMGINLAMCEEMIVDEQTGRMVNPDFEFYKLGGMLDMPEIIVHMHDMPERGVIGIGEPPTISTAAAIGNAICNALGVRVPRTPFSPDRVLAALHARK
ncbi:MAG: xanthine dehydrogenase family protein molybdopterin-binding subunit [Gemmatales bacterium]|nr:xanthine dehydrogenase family protein molybdopterin-binding subunit [Gemmatales bacterium]MDW8175959.1 xanthine dehydrogenase family protein molybdopterin-binding subunit [Gemmatales bacterium]